MKEKKKYTMDDYALELRHNILITALALENLTSMYLAGLLGIEDFKATKSFGNRSGNLSFNQKIELLIDLDAISKDEKKKFQSFMEVRNQFMHNIDVRSYTECFQLLDGKEKFVLKLYPQDESTIKEVRLRIAIEALGLELMDTINNLGGKVFKSEMTKVKSEMHGLIQSKFSESIQKMKSINENKVSNKIAQNEGLSHTELVSLNEEIESNFKGFWKSN